MEYRPRRSSQCWLSGAPKHIIACYDNGGRSGDRYTIVFNTFWKDYRGQIQIDALASSERPFHPQGIGLSVSIPAYMDRKRLGKKVTWESLPEDVKTAAAQYGEE